MSVIGAITIACLAVVIIANGFTIRWQRQTIRYLEIARKLRARPPEPLTEDEVRLMDRGQKAR